MIKKAPQLRGFLFAFEIMENGNISNWQMAAGNKTELPELNLRPLSVTQLP
ncbi:MULTISPECIES: hypothetical protein [unclassified Pseudomonas]|uniref:hypothetical protein n=1 Tax=unclassified Pseudomonas TaxID=196821 RepID=UPI0024586E9F|nr:MULTISPECIES: hypothetical protein [unclassified Pseudomonas]